MQSTYQLFALLSPLGQWVGKGVGNLSIWFSSEIHTHRVGSSTLGLIKSLPPSYKG